MRVEFRASATEVGNLILKAYILRYALSSGFLVRMLKRCNNTRNSRIIATVRKYWNRALRPRHKTTNVCGEVRSTISPRPPQLGFACSGCTSGLDVQCQQAVRFGLPADTSRICLWRCKRANARMNACTLLLSFKVCFACVSFNL
jgi:hypothetical protein